MFRGKKSKHFNKNFNRGRQFKTRQQANKKQYINHENQLQESDVGITEFINKCEGFSAVIKARYSDFHVNEIDMKGNIAKLTDTSIPKDFIHRKRDEDFRNIKDSPLEEISQEKWDCIKSMVLNSEKHSVSLDVSNFTKEIRKKIHETMKNLFGSKIVASTVDEDGKKFIEFKISNKGGFIQGKIKCFLSHFQNTLWKNLSGLFCSNILCRNSVIPACSLSLIPLEHLWDELKTAVRRRPLMPHILQELRLALTEDYQDIPQERINNEDTRFKWPEDKGEYVHFLVHKEAMDTLDACLKICDCLRLSSSAITYAGVKDRRAKTTQWASIKKVMPWKLIVKTKPIRRVHIGNITFKDSPIKLGQLLGNKFRIAVRNVLTSDDCIKESMESLDEKGYTNYFGLQRFGNDKEVPTYVVGINLLQGNFKEAVSLILKPKSSDDPDLDVSKAKKIYFDTSDAEQALTELNENENICIEAKLLSGLVRGHANDYVNALENIPRNIRLLYIHSFQSFIWNQMASKRIKEYGFLPAEGDLVLANEEECFEHIENDCESLTDDTTDEMHCRHGVRILKKEDLPKYTIYDVVLPLPGFDVVYPENLKQYYKEALEEHGLSLEMPKQKVKTYTLSGAYRKLVGRVKNLSWKVMLYNDPNSSLIRSDLEELRGDKEPESVENGQYKALIMEFELNPASYATMVLREILKCDTSSASHAKLNDYHEVNKEKKISAVGTQMIKVSDTDLSTTSSLLSDTKEYEKFKNSIFEAVSLPEKRKVCDGSCPENKKAKLDSIEAENISTD